MVLVVILLLWTYKISIIIINKAISLINYSYVNFYLNQTVCSQRERKQRKLYSDEWALGDDEAEGGRGFSLADKLESPRFEFPNAVHEMQGADLTVNYLQKHGFTTPLLFKEKLGLGLRYVPTIFFYLLLSCSEWASRFMADAVQFKHIQFYSEVEAHSKNILSVFNQTLPTVHFILVERQSYKILLLIRISIWASFLTFLMEVFIHLQSVSKPKLTVLQKIVRAIRFLSLPAQIYLFWWIFSIGDYCLMVMYLLLSIT